LAHIIDQFTPPHDKYVEVFTGAAHVFFAKSPVPHEVLNDRFKGLTDFYEVIQHPRLLEEFIELVNRKLYSRNEFKHCKKNWKRGRSKVKRVVEWFVVARQCMFGLFEANWCSEPNRIARDMPADISKWISAIDGLPEIHERIRRTRIENLDFRKLIPKYDGPLTWFYCDPPYVPDTRKSGKYEHEMTCSDHLDLVDILLGIKGMCLLSGYDTDLYEPLEAMGWWRERREVYCAASKDKRMEYLWLSPNLQKALKDCGKEWKISS
jgi:DNA adenine methylase